MSNIYANYAPRYLKHKLPVIPDKFMKKQPAIKNWSAYCYQLPTLEEVESWSNRITESNIALCLGEISGVIGLDLDTDRADIMELIKHMLPESPVEKRGSKGYTRFFRYNGERNHSINFDGDCILEVLSSGKKTTIPPSIHPNGSSYVWVTDTELLDIEATDLPFLPTNLLANIESTLKTQLTEISRDKNAGANIISGRNAVMVKECARLKQSGNKSLDEMIKELVKYDNDNNSPPYFTDSSEFSHTHAPSNALSLYSDVNKSHQSQRFRTNDSYETLLLESSLNWELAEKVRSGKSPSLVKEKKLNHVLPDAKGAVKTLQSNILANSWIKQPELAMSAALIILATLTSRKVMFEGLSPNLYLLNIAPSGSGKDAPQQMIKKYLMDIGGEYLLGAGDYVSDAALMDDLANNPTRLDIMDEAGGILKTVTGGKSEYNGKMGDILCQLYTSSSSKYLGRAVSDGVKGACYRPNVNILASTTPTGFSEGISRSAIDKGLMGRFLLFFGRGNKKAERVKKITNLDTNTQNLLTFWLRYKADLSDELMIAGIEQQVTSLTATPNASALLDTIFEDFQELRVNMSTNDPTDVLIPIVSRLYQQMTKIMIVHACGRSEGDVPEINEDDVIFAKKLIMYYYTNIQDAINEFIYDGDNDKQYKMLLKTINDFPLGLTIQQLSAKTRALGKWKRDNLLTEMVENEDVIKIHEQRDGRMQMIIRSIK